MREIIARRIVLHCAVVPERNRSFLPRETAAVLGPGMLGEQRFREPHRLLCIDRFCGATVDQVILAGMSANLCMESHLRELLEQGFEVAVVRDATAAAKAAEGDGYQAALVNFGFLAGAVVSTEDAVKLIG